MKPMLILLTASAIFAGEGYDPGHIDTDSCKTFLHNTNWCYNCVQSTQERIQAAARNNRQSIADYIEQAVMERLEYDEEEYFFSTGKTLK